MRCFVTALVVAGLSLGWAGGVSANDEDDFEGETLIGFEVDFRWDLGSMRRETTVERNPFRNQRSDLSGFGPTFRFLFLRQLGEHLSLGAGFQYNALASYESDGDVNDDNFVLGQQLVLDAKLELRKALSDQLELVGMPRLGLVIISPGGDLDEAIADNRNAGLTTWNTPRLGFLIGADLGIRWRPEDVSWLRIRASVGYAWQHTWLMNSRGSSGPIDTHDKWTASLSRFRVGAGLEFVF